MECHLPLPSRRRRCGEADGRARLAGALADRVRALWGVCGARGDADAEGTPAETLESPRQALRATSGLLCGSASHAWPPRGFTVSSVSDTRANDGRMAYEQTRDELWQQLAEQRAFLLTSAAAYDNGAASEAKRLAVTLRVLLYDYRRSRSLLGARHLDLLDSLPMVDTAGPVTGDVGMAALLVMSTYNDPEWSFRAKCSPPQPGDGPRTNVERMTLRSEDYEPPFTGSRLIPFQQWWTDPVVVTLAGDYSRADLVVSVANKDGGAHVDPTLTPEYAALARENAVRMYTREADGFDRPMESPVLPSVRQIAHEVLETIEGNRDRFGPLFVT